MNCTVSNSTSQNRTFLYHLTGGCIRTINIFFRKFENVQIFDSFSDKTAYGIIINDNSQTPVFANNFEFSNKSIVNFILSLIKLMFLQIIIKNCAFKNNSIYINGESQETAGAIYLKSDLEANIIDCIFLVLHIFK